jgi:uncharacterized protein (DUF983 family)
MSDFTESIGKLRLAAGLCSGCDVCGMRCGMENESDLEAYIVENGDDGFFSMDQCESCKSHLGGQRYAAHDIIISGEMVHYDICIDCVMYHSHGEEPEYWEKD